MLTWIENNGFLLGWTAALSVASIVLVLVAVPIVVARLPVDYFRHDRRDPVYLHELHPLVGLAVAGLKNLLGLTLILLGIVMILTPGQGLLTMLLGVLLVNFPGKYRFELWLVRQRGVLKAVNWLRAKEGKPPMLAPLTMKQARESDAT